jgi:beta-alanine--pyruvate transaminase
VCGDLRVTLDISRPNTLEAYWMPFTANRAFKARPRLIVRAKGLHYETPEGARILDATSGLYCVNAGHGRPEIADAIKRAADTLDFAPPFQHGHPAAFELASRLAALAPADLDVVLFATSGSEAVETALKVALAFQRQIGQGGRTRLIGRERGYHGVGLAGTAVGGMLNNRRQFGIGALVSGTDHLPTTYNRSRQAFSVGEPEWGAELADDLVKLVNLHGADTIAAVIVEPVAGSTGCLAPPKGYLERLRKITAEHGILLIFDEVITGFGRLGCAFAAGRYGIVPDMITFAKGATNGAAPLSGVLVRKAIYDAFMTGPENQIELFHGFTYSGHPLGVAAGLATLDVYKNERLFERAEALEPMFAQIMMGLKCARHVVDIRPVGLMCGIDLEPRTGAPGARGFEVIERAFHENDLYVRVVGDTLVVAPPLIANLDDLAEIAERISNTLKNIE